MKYIKAFEELKDKVNDYQKYIGKWVIIKALYAKNNHKITIAQFIDIPKDNFVHLYISKNTPFSVGGHCGVHISAFDVLDYCDNEQETKEMLNNAKMKEEAKKYNL
jgi:hypothetical protein